MFVCDFVEDTLYNSHYGYLFNRDRTWIHDGNDRSGPPPHVLMGAATTLHYVEALQVHGFDNTGEALGVELLDRFSFSWSTSFLCIVLGSAGPESKWSRSVQGRDGMMSLFNESALLIPPARIPPKRSPALPNKFAKCLSRSQPYQKGFVLGERPFFCCLFAADSE